MSFKQTLNRSLKQLANDEVFSINRWFRNKYQLSPKDPAYLNCEQWEIELEYLTTELERDIGKTGIFCKNCGALIISGVRCSKCGINAGVIAHFDDPDFNEYFEKTEKDNENFIDSSSIKWEVVQEEENA